MEQQDVAEPASAAPLLYVGATESAYLAGLSASGSRHYRAIPQKANGAEAAFQGSVQDFVAANPGLAPQMRNEAKRCHRCGKGCATMLPFCNGCDNDLAEAPVTYTENVCMAFVYGVERDSRGPLRLSLRAEAPDVLVYDDLLARGSCHLNAIPTDCHLPDWRHLLRNPAKGLDLMRRLDEACWGVVRDQFWADEAWRTSTFREGAFASAEDFRSQIHAGVNSVPSQFQIHLQYIVPGIGPVDYNAFLHGKRFVKGRWLPLEYVFESLEALVRSECGANGVCGLPNAHEMSMEAIFEAIERTGGPAYAEGHTKAIRRYNCTHQVCANWRPEHFDAVVVLRHPALRPELLGAAGDSRTDAEEARAWEVRPLRGGQAPAPSRTPTELERADKAAIQSYGRPYGTEDGLPRATSYYAFARRPGEVASAEAWAAASGAASV